MTSTDSRASELLWADLLASRPVNLCDFDAKKINGMIDILNRRGEQEIVGSALLALKQPDVWFRFVAVRTLAEHGIQSGLDSQGGAPFNATVLPVLTAELGSESSAVVRAELVTALARSGDRGTLALVLERVTDSSAKVRRAVAAELPLWTGQTEASEVDALLVLMEDTDPEVRDWATFSIGLKTDSNERRVNTALRRRLDEQSIDDEYGSSIVASAVQGLARRHDPIVFPILQEWLANPEVGDLPVEAAGDLGDPRLLSALILLREQGWRPSGPRPHVLPEAIDALTVR